MPRRTSTERRQHDPSVSGQATSAQTPRNGKREYRWALRWEGPDGWRCESTGTADRTQAEALQKQKWAELNIPEAEPEPSRQPEPVKASWDECKDALKRAMEADNLRPSYVHDLCVDVRCVPPDVPRGEDPGRRDARDGERVQAAAGRSRSLPLDGQGRLGNPEGGLRQMAGEGVWLADVQPLRQREAAEVRRSRRADRLGRGKRRPCSSGLGNAGTTGDCPLSTWKWQPSWAGGPRKRPVSGRRTCLRMDSCGWLPRTARPAGTSMAGFQPTCTPI